MNLTKTVLVISFSTSLMALLVALYAIWLMNHLRRGLDGFEQRLNKFREDLGG